MIAFPNIDPVALALGPLKIHWYGVAYVVGIFLAIKWGGQLLKNFDFPLPVKFFDDFIPYSVAGIIIGGRLGHVLFFDFSRYLENPLEILMVWKGGMAFHGGLLGVIVAIFYYAKKYKVNFYDISDLLALIAPIGLFFGRIANFINAELFGIVTTKSWGVIFPGQSLPRHPTQIYESLLEGLVLFLVLNIAYAKCAFFRKQKGVTASLFLILYALFRLFVEQFKLQNTVVNLFNCSLGSGGWLCIIMLLVGALILMLRLRDCANLSKKTGL